MINRECGVYQTTYEGDMALYPLPLARYSTLGVVAVLVLLPLVLDSHAMSLVNLMLLASIGAIGLNILVGYTGQVSLGHGAFMMVGSYTAALVTLRLGAPFWVGLPAGGAMAALVGTFFGIPSLRIKGLYLAIATLAGQFIIEWSINSSSSGASTTAPGSAGACSRRSSCRRRPFSAGRSTASTGATPWCCRSRSSLTWRP